MNRGRRGYRGGYDAPGRGTGRGRGRAREQNGEWNLGRPDSRPEKIVQVSSKQEATKREDNMRVVVSSNGADLDAQVSHTFGRCPMYLFVDTESMRFEAATNPASAATSGAGVQAAQFVTGTDIQAIITGEVGPKAMNVLQAARIPIYLFRGGTVRQAVEDFKAGKLPIAPGSKAPVEQASGKEIAPGLKKTKSKCSRAK